MKGVGWGVVLLTVAGSGCSEDGRVASIPSVSAAADAPTPFPGSLPSSTSALASATECHNPVVLGYPSDGSVDVYPGSAIWFALARPDPNAEIAVTDASGAPLAGDTTITGAYVSWVGEALESDAMYVATVSTACGPQIAEFTTSVVGAPLDADPTGTAFAVNLADGVLYDPQGVGPGFGPGAASVLVAPYLDQDRLDLLSALGDSNHQDPCGETSWLGVDAWADPKFAVGGGRLPVTIGRGTVSFSEVTTTGGFFPDGSGVQLGRLVAEIDTREVARALSPRGNEDAWCGPPDRTDPPCHPCADGASYCMSIVVDGLSGTFTAVRVAERTANEIAYDPGCD